MLKLLLNFFLGSLILLSLFQCASAPRLENGEQVFGIGEIYYQKWVAGIPNGGSGINLYFTTAYEKYGLVIDSIYFRGKIAKPKFNPESQMFIASFQSINNKKDIILSDKPNAEFGNEAPIIPKKFPFDLKEDECVISYIDGNNTRYFKIENIKEKQMLSYPSTPSNKQ